MLSQPLEKARRGEDLTMEEMAQAIGSIMQGQCEEDQIGELLLALREKGEAVAEIAGAAAAMRQQMTKIVSSRTDLLDTCGTGGDGSGIFNVSTAAAIVAAAAGVAVAKHGNRGITSKSGSADVLATLGVNLDASVETIQTCLDEVGLCFCFAPQLHASMKHVAPVRKKLGVPTIFNMLGPLCNPAGADYQLLGVGKPHLRPLLSAALQMLGAQRAVVVCGEDGLDEVTLTGATHVSEVTPEGVREFTWTPAEFGLPENGLDSLKVDGPEQSAAVIDRILNGEIGPARDIVVLNAAAALWTAGRSDSTETCAVLAAQAIDSGAARAKLEHLSQASQS